MTISLKTRRLLLRPWREDDLEPFTTLNSDPEVMRYFPRHLDHEATADVVRKMRAHHDKFSFGYWPIEVPGVSSFVGMAGLMITPFNAHFTPCIEIAWRLARPYWGRGYATEGALASLTFAFSSLQMLEEVVAFAVPDNRRSLGVMERIGMVRRPDDDFDHPSLPEGHRLRRHCLYRISRDRWSSLSADRDDVLVKVLRG